MRTNERTAGSNDLFVATPHRLAKWRCNQAVGLRPHRSHSCGWPVRILQNRASPADIGEW